MHRTALLVALIFSSLGCGGPPPVLDSGKPKLVVMVVFDQMRGDYPERWRTLFGNDGFNRIRREGATFTNCRYPYGSTTTGPGHASLLSGCGPETHGIINNEWYDVREGADVNCAESTRYQRVPRAKAVVEEAPPIKKDPDAKLPVVPKPDSDPPRNRIVGVGAPDRLLAPTLGDVVREVSGGKGRVVGLSFKDRSAVLTPGRKADSAYWLDSSDGSVVTSTYYRDSLPKWVSEFNARKIPDKWFGRDWIRLNGQLDYVRYSGPDDAIGEGKGSKQGLIFPHPTDGGLTKPGRNFYEALYNSAYGNDFLLEFAKTAIVEEKLGQNAHTDLVTISFSSNDAVGHCWGPDSQEVLDTTLRSDLVVAELLKFLDEKIGKGQYLLALSADHGICPLPEVSVKKGIAAERVNLKAMLIAAEEHLSAKFGRPDSPDAKKPIRWIEGGGYPWIWLNRKQISDRKLDAQAVADELAAFLQLQPGIHRTMTRPQLEGHIESSDEIGRLMKVGYFAERSGDVGVILKEYHLPSSGKITETGTTHGSVWDYDRHVPLMVFGMGVKAGVRTDAITPMHAAAILATGAGLPMPKMAKYATLPAGLFVEK